MDDFEKSEVYHLGNEKKLLKILPGKAIKNQFRSIFSIPQYLLATVYSPEMALADHLAASSIIWQLLVLDWANLQETK